MRTVFPRAIPLALAAALPAMTVTAVPACAQQATARPGDITADALQRIGTPHARALSNALRRGAWHARRVEGQGRFAAPGAVPHLVAALRDERPIIRRLALWGLAELRAGEAEAEILPFLADPTPAVRGEAARALSDMQASDQALRIAALLQDRDAFVRVQAAHALGDLQHPGTGTALAAARTDSDAAVRGKAGWALARVREAERILARRRGR
jgi:HEAT repeat protein